MKPRSAALRASSAWRYEERFLSARADPFAGAKGKERHRLAPFEMTAGGAVRGLFEVEEDVNGGFGGVGLEPVADGIEMEGQVAKNFFLMSLKLRENILKF